MGITSKLVDGIAEVILDHPPVNALPVQAWFDLAEAIRRLGAQPDARVLVLRAEGRGFCAGVDIKELGRATGHDALVAVNHACYQAFAAVYECTVPVIAAVNGFCLGGGIGLVGNADMVLAARDATFGLPEVDRGALGAATHLMRLVPLQRARHMLYTCQTATAEELHRYGSVLQVVAPAELCDAALALATQIAAKDPVVVRAAKQALNGIDPVDVKQSYRFEQGFTFELNLLGAGARARAAFIAEGSTGGSK